MSLRAVHVFVMAASLVLAAWLATWSIEGGHNLTEMGRWELGAASLLFAVGIGFYLAWFINKVHKLHL